jgi:hypothetical protein
MPCNCGNNGTKKPTTTSGIRTLTPPTSMFTTNGTRKR